MGKNKGQETVQMYRWDQYNERWIPFTGSVDTQGKVKIVADSLPIPTGAATSANQTNGSQKTQIVDAGGEAATVTSGKLDVNAALDTTGLASDDSLMLLRDIRKLLKASAYKDVGDRQIVKIGALGGISGGAEVTTTMPVSGSVTATVASTTITAVGGFDARFQLYDIARVKYATGMRANLLLS